MLALVRHRMFIPVLLGLSLRLALAPFTEQRWDSYVNRLMGAYAFGYGINPLFPERSCNCPPVLNYSYPPIWLLLVLPSFGIWLLLVGYRFPSSPASLWTQGTVTGNLFESYRSFVPPTLPLLDLVLKVPIIISDIVVGFMIWRLGGRTARAARVSLFSWMLNPYVIAMGAVWGEFDSIAVMFVLLSIYYLTLNKPVSSSLWLALGVSTKLFPAVLIPPLVLHVYKKGRSIVLRYTLVLVATIAAIFSLLLLFPYGIEYIGRLLTGRLAPDRAGKSVFAGLSWMVLFNTLPPLPQFPIFPIALIATAAPVLVKLRRGFGNAEMLLPLATASFLPVFLSYPTINVQYPIWAIPLLASLVSSRKLQSWSIAAFSSLPLLLMLVHFNPLYLISPAFVWDETNYPPASDVILQIWNFPPELYTILPGIFTLIVVAIIFKLMQANRVVGDAKAG